MRDFVFSKTRRKVIEEIFIEEGENNDKQEKTDVPSQEIEPSTNLTEPTINEGGEQPEEASP